MQHRTAEGMLFCLQCMWTIVIKSCIGKAALKTAFNSL